MLISNLSYMRHAEQWFKPYEDLSLEDCLAADDAFEDVLDRDVVGWLSNFQTDAIMTP